jgi:DNA-binding GntR family transcriptional regulator
MRKEPETPASMSDQPISNLAHSPVSRAVRVADQVYGHLRRAIIHGEIKPGRRLRETEVAAALNVSRTPVREAISRLIGDWLVRELQTGGVEVVDPAAELAEIYYIREALETCAARLAAARITGEQLAKLERLVKSARRASFKERVRINQEFHMTIAEAAGSARLLAMIRGLREYFLNPRWISHHNRAMTERALRDHRKIVAALRTRSADQVERLLRQHLKLGWEQLIADMALNDER